MADRMIQKPLVCRNAHCGASCDRMTVEQMCYLYKDITKCPFYVRRDDLYENDYTSKVLDKIRAEIEFEVDHRTNMLCAEDVLEIIDKYRESEGE